MVTRGRISARTGPAADDLALVSEPGPAVDEAVMVRRNALAIRRVVAALRALGCVEAVDEGVIALARATAESLDRAPPGTAAAASCARAHALSIDRLRGLTAHDASDALDGLLGSLGDPAQP